MVYLSRRRRRRMQFSVFVLLLVWLLGVAAAHDLTMLLGYAAIALVGITVDLTAGRRGRGLRRLPSRRHRGAAAARSGPGSRPARRARSGRTSARRPGTAT